MHLHLLIVDHRRMTSVQGDGLHLQRGALRHQSRQLCLVLLHMIQGSQPCLLACFAQSTHEVKTLG